MTRDQLIEQAVTIAKEDGHIDLVKLAQALNIDVYAKEEEGSFNAEMSFDKSSDSYFIVINANQPLVRQRFSIAHELAHYILHKEKLDTKPHTLNRDTNRESVNKKMEEEADSMAAEVLMPENLVVDFCEKNGVDKKHMITESIINSVADHFKVSRIVALLRLRHLGFYVPYIAFS